MKNQIKNATNWLKEQSIKGCITGSSLLGEYWEGMDVDVFAYNKEAFTELFYAMYHNPMFQILNAQDEWKADLFRKEETKQYKVKILTIKFTYNMCIPINIILKENANNIFSILSTFDMDIISKGFDIMSGKYLDLGNETNRQNKIADWNRWNPNFNDPNIWHISKILRQLERVFKYHKRGYNTDNLVYKYISIINNIRNYQNIFNSIKFDEKLKTITENTKIVKQICEVWLDTHEITENQIELLKTKIKEI